MWIMGNPVFQYVGLRTMSLKDSFVILSHSGRFILSMSSMSPMSPIDCDKQEIREIDLAIDRQKEARLACSGIYRSLSSQPGVHTPHPLRALSGGSNGSTLLLVSSVQPPSTLHEQKGHCYELTLLKFSSAALLISQGHVAKYRMKILYQMDCGFTIKTRISLRCIHYPCHCFNILPCKAER